MLIFGMKIIFSETVAELGVKAATLTAKHINNAIKEKGNARIILSTGASQFSTLEALVQQDIDWSKVEIFHLDEYIDLGQEHPASFIKYLKERVVEKLPNLKAIHFVDATDGVDKIMKKLEVELEKEQIDVGLIGIGENTHIAFNDPPADFDAKSAYKVVDLDLACRKQQMGEGWFATIDDVPKQAISMTVSQILKCKYIISAVPHAVKAEAIKKTLTTEGVTNMLPSTAFKTHDDVTIFVDANSSALINREKYNVK